MKWLTRLLSTVDYDNITDEVTLTLLHKKILRQKKVLRRLYENYYRRHLSLLTTEMDYHTYPILEIGAGGGFFKEACPSAITSDVLPLDSNDIVFSATRIPLKAETISNIVLLNVLHHINRPFEFFSEAERVHKSRDNAQSSCNHSRYKFNSRNSNIAVKLTCVITTSKTGVCL